MENRISDTKIKICGLRREADIMAVNELLPEYIGFVFAESSRQVTREQAALLKSKLSKEIQTVGVFVNAALEVIEQICQEGILDLVQLHGDESINYIEELKTRISNPIIRAVRVKSKEQILEAEKEPVDFLLLDTYTKYQYGGSGETFNSSIVPDLRKPYFLAGGLHEENVIKSIHDCIQSKPLAVDVSSAVETDGWKDREKIRMFIEKVRKGV